MYDETMTLYISETPYWYSYRWYACLNDITAVNYTSILLSNALNWLGRKLSHVHSSYSLVWEVIPTLYQNTHINWFNLYHFNNNIWIHVIYKRYQLYQVLQHKGNTMTVPSFNCDTLKILKYWLLFIINVIKVFECCTFQFFHFFFIFWLYECCSHGNTLTV